MQDVCAAVPDGESADNVSDDDLTAEQSTSQPEEIASGPRLRLADLAGLSVKQSNARVLKELARNASRPAPRIDSRSI